jgi:hypothetical protein
LEYLLFAIYLVIFVWLVTKIPFFRRSGLSDSQLVIIFLLKVMAGIFYGWIGLYYSNVAQMSDTWGYHYNSLIEYQLLGKDPHAYFTNLFQNNYEHGFDRFFSGTNSYWNDLKANSFVKFLSLLDIFSFGNYYVNVIFYSFISMFGPIALYRVMTDVFPGKKIQVLVASFLVPSFIYWTSGIHKDGLVFTGLAVVAFNVYFGLKEKRFGVKRILLILAGLLIMLALRNFLIVVIVPALLAWFISQKFPKYSIAIFAGLYIFFGIAFFTMRYISPKFDFPDAVVEKQKEFLKLQGGSAVPIRKLEPTAASFLANAPQALNLSIIRPYPSDVRHLLSLAAATEINFLLFLFVLLLIFRTDGIRSRVFLYFSLFFSFTLLLSIGYTVNFLGAIVRYRSIVLPFLVVPLVAEIDWKRIFELISGNIKNKNNLTKI